MEWFWALFSAFWTACAVALVLGGRRALMTFEKQGFIDYGLGKRIVKTDDPNAFRLVIWFYKIWATLGMLMVMVGVGTTIGWLWRAL